MIMIVNVLLPDEAKLYLDSIEIGEKVIVLSVSSNSPTSLCPSCGVPSDHVHSHYQRCPGDLPLVGFAVRLDMNVRRFFCDNNDCKQSIFTERIPSILASSARRTHRLANQQRQVAFALGGEAGASLLAIMGMTVSPDTLLRFIRRTPEPEVITPRVLGVDDWAKRKGQSYGTILVNLETHRPADLLPDRTAESFANWLKEHSGVEIISRDRGPEYIKGANEGAPDAVQVADRWHLLTNLRDALKQMLESKHACLKAAADKTQPAEAPAIEQMELSVSHEEQSSESAKVTNVLVEPSDVSAKLTKAERRKLERQERRQKRFEAVKELHGQGLYISEIACLLNIDCKTVNKYVRANECPIYPEKRVRRPGKLDPYKEYITGRWQSDCHNSTQILDEIRQLGYNGSRSIMMDWVAKTFKPSHPSHLPSSYKTVVPWSTSRASWLLVKKKDELTAEEEQALERMKEADEKVAEAYTLGQRFTDMIRERRPELLLPWLEDVANSRINALKSFAKGIKQDLTAVTNALSLPWSNGQVEGQVNRLKLIKRQMYGRANFDLLRKRVLGVPELWNPG